MVARHRGKITLAVLTITVLAAISTAGYRAFRLPAPEHANRSQLLRWIVLRDLEQETRTTQVHLLNRLQEELQQGWDDWGNGTELSDARQQRVQQNTLLLQKVWFEQRCDEYAAIPATERMEFLDRQIQGLFRWCEVQATLAGDSPQGSTTTDTAKTFFDQIERWIDAAPAPHHDRMEAAVYDAIICWLAIDTDLNDYPADFRRDLAGRVAEGLDECDGPATLELKLSAAQQAQLAHNSKCLAQAWLLEQAAGYEALERHERTTFLDQQLDRIERWGIMRWFADDSEGASGPLTQFAELGKEWTESAGSEDKPRLKRLLSHIQQRVVWRSVQSLIPSGKRR